MADSPWAQIIASLITNVMAPELVAWLKSRNVTNIPTEAELRDHLLAITGPSIAVGEAFLRAKGVEPS